MAAFFAALPAFIAALPDMMRIAVKMMTLMEKIVRMMEKNGTLKWMEEVEGAIDELERANTPDAKISAARRISGLMRSTTQ